MNMPRSSTVLYKREIENGFPDGMGENWTPDIWMAGYWINPHCMITKCSGEGVGHLDVSVILECDDLYIGGK